MKVLREEDLWAERSSIQFFLKVASEHLCREIKLSKDGVLTDINWEPTMCRKKGGNARSRPL